MSTTKRPKNKICWDCKNPTLDGKRYCASCTFERVELQKQSIKKKHQELNGISTLVSQILGEDLPTSDKTVYRIRSDVQQCGGGFRIMAR